MNLAGFITVVAMKLASTEFIKDFMVLVLLKYLIYINMLYIVGKRIFHRFK